MSWQPLNEKNAIERVRILVQFKNKLTLQELNEIANETLKNYSELGFERPKAAESVIQNIPVDSELGFPFTEKVNEGWLINRSSNEKLVEEAGFRVGVFGYLNTEYTRWNDLIDRYWKIFRIPLEKSIEKFGVNSIRLEYLDKFSFRGEIADAKTSDIISSHDPTIPERVFLENSLWHSHVGWFEYIENIRTLVQRNLELGDILVSESKERTLSIFTLVEMSQIPENISINAISNYLTQMHNKAIYAIGTTITEEMRKKIGINLEDYEE